MLKFPTICVGNSLQYFFPIRPSKSLQLGKFPTYRNTAYQASPRTATYVYDKGRPSPERLRSPFAPYVGCHVCMSVCLSLGLSVICASSKCERKRPGLGRPLSPVGVPSLDNIEAVMLGAI